jgi:dsRNA-specific ribonuclease
MQKRNKNAVKQSSNANFTQNNINQGAWFKDGDFKNHILNEKNIPITENFINKIFKKYSFSHKVQNLQNFQIAMTHVSYLNKSIVKDKTAKLLKDVEPISKEKRHLAMPLQQRDYNTFEYYGDSVIHLILTQYLYNRYLTKDSGFLTKLRTKLEKAETLSILSKKIGFDRYVVIGRNMEQNNARENDVHLTEDIFEAFIWALFLETNYEKCKEFMINLIEREIDFAELISSDDNYKEKIMQYFHKMKWKDPKYIEKVEDRKTSANCHNQEFVIQLINQENNTIIGIGTGNTKSKAEQNAAYCALVQLKEISLPGGKISVDSLNEYYCESETDLNFVSNLDKKSSDSKNSSKNNSDDNNSDSDYFEYEENEENKENKDDNTTNNISLSWFKDEDYRNHMLNEKNERIDPKFFNNILRRYGLAHKIKNIDIFQTAMTHVSYLDKITLKEKTALLLKDIPPISDEDKKNVLELQKDDYSRLSHLGNALARLALTVYLSDRYPTKDQGFLTRLRIKIERAETLSTLANQLDLTKYAIIARNMELNGSRHDDISLMKGIFEAFIGALSLELSYNECRKLLINLFERDIDFAELLNTDDNYKEKLMQYFHKMKWKEPKYIEKEKEKEKEKENEEKDDKDENEEENNNEENINQEREFIMYIKNQEGNILGVGVGNTKSKGEQNAARDALIRLNVLNDSSDCESDYYGEVLDSDEEYYEADE